MWHVSCTQRIQGNCQLLVIENQIAYRNPALRECEDETHTPEMGIHETWEFNGKCQNTSH
jgi:hypothetical protein